MLELPEHKTNSALTSRHETARGWATDFAAADLEFSDWYSVAGSSRLRALTYPCLLAERITQELGRPCRVFDLGSGHGKACLYFAKSGCEVMGVEADIQGFSESIENIKKSKDHGIIAVDAKVRILHGSFFPKDMHVQRRFNVDDVFARHIRALKTVSLDLHPSNYTRTDLFYHYQVESIENLLNFLLKCGRPGALLYLVDHGCGSGRNLSKTPRGITYLNPQGVVFPGEGHLYQKKI